MKRARVVAAVVAALLIAIVAALQIPLVATWTARRLLTLAPLNPGYRLDIGRAGGTWLGSLELRDVTLRHHDRELVRLHRVRVTYNVFRLASSRAVRSVDVQGLDVTARRDSGGWDIARAFRTGQGTAAAGGTKLSVGRLDVVDANASAQRAPDSVMAIRDVRIAARDLVVGSLEHVLLDTLRARLESSWNPANPVAILARGSVRRDAFVLDTLALHSARSALAGRAVLPRQLDDARQVDQLSVTLRATPLALADLAPIVPSIRPAGLLHLEIDADGLGRLVAGTVRARLGDATVLLDGSMLAGADAPVRLRLEGDVRSLDPARVLRNAAPGRITGTVSLALDGERLDRSSGRVRARLEQRRPDGRRAAHVNLVADIVDGRADAQLRGAAGRVNALARGWARAFDSIPQYAASGTVQLPTADSSLTVQFRVAGRDARMEASAATTLAGGRVAMRGGVDLDSARYQLNGTIEEVDLAALIDDTLAGPVSGRLALDGRGFDSDSVVASARVDVSRVAYRGQVLSDLVAHARIANARAAIRATGALDSGRVLLVGTARRTGAVIAFSLDSALVEQLNPGKLLGRPDLERSLTVRGQASGRVGPDVRVIRAQASLDPDSFGTVRVAEARANALLTAARGRFETTLRTNRGTLRARGERAPAPGASGWTFEGTVDSLDLGGLLGGGLPETSIAATITGSLSGAPLDRGRGQVALELLPSRVNDARVGPGTARLEMTAGRLAGSISLPSGDARAMLTVTGRLDASRSEIGVTGTAQLAGLERWLGDSLFDGGAQAHLALHVALDSARLRSADGTLRATGRIGRLALDTLYVKLDPGEGITIDTLIVRSTAGRMDGGGRFALDTAGPPATLRVNGRLQDLAAVGRLVRLEPLSLDSAGFSLVVSGTPAERDIAATGFAHRFLYANTLVERLRADVRATAADTGLTALDGEVDVRGVATRALTIQRLTAAATYDSSLVLQAAADLGAGVTVSLEGSGTRDDSTMTARVTEFALTEGGRRWTLEHDTAVVIRRADGLAAHDLELRAGDRRVAIEGVASFRDSSDLTVRVLGLDLNALEHAGLVPAGGVLDASLTLRGPAAQPRLTGDVSLELPAGSVEASVTWNARALRVRVSALDREGRELTASGRLPWGLTLAGLAIRRDPRDTLDLELRSAGFDIGFFQHFLPAGTITNLRGELVADAHVGGSADAPAARGDLTISDLGLEMPLIDVRYRRGTFAATLGGKVMRVDTLALSTGDDQRLAATGSVTLEPLSNPALDLTAQLDDFVLSNAGVLEARATGNAHLGGTVAAPMVSGSFVVSRAEFHAAGGAVLDVQDVTLTAEDSLTMARHFGPRMLAGADPRARLLDRVGLDLDVRLPQQAWFRREAAPSINVEVTGRVHIRQQPGEEMEFFGTAEILPGQSTLDVFGRTFELTGGDVVLDGPATQIKLDVTAQYRPPVEGGSEENGVLVTVVASGHVDSLNLAFTSDPNMSRDDIVSYIVTGRPASDNPLLGGTGDARGEKLVLSQLGEALTDVVGRELGFEVFQIRQEPEQGLVLTAGRHVTSRLYASLKQPLELGGEASRLPGTTLGPGFELQYRLLPWLRLNIRGGSLPTGILLLGRYAY